MKHAANSLAHDNVVFVGHNGAMMQRRRFLILSILALTPTLAGCPSKPAPVGSGGVSTSDGKGGVIGPNSHSKSILAGLVTDVGGLNDKSFNASAWAGLQKAEKELGLKIKSVESRQNADYVPNLSRFGKEKYQIVFAVGGMMRDAVKEVADKFPDTFFVLIDGEDVGLRNVRCYRFKEEEGSFLAGALAGLITKSNVIGFVGGQQMPLIEKFQYGYQYGAQTTNPNVNVLVGYAGKFNDPAKGQEVALNQLGSRADILYHAAGGSGVGVIKAVASKTKGVWAIGVDQDQDGLAPGRVLTSMVKRVDKAVFDACEQLSRDKLDRGEVVWGLKEDGITLSEMTFTKKDIPAEALKKLDGLKARIIDGKLPIPTTARDYADMSKNPPTP